MEKFTGRLGVATLVDSGSSAWASFRPAQKVAAQAKLTRARQPEEVEGYYHLDDEIEAKRIAGLPDLIDWPTQGYSVEITTTRISVLNSVILQLP